MLLSKIPRCLVDSTLRGPADRAALKVHVVHAVHIGLVAACRTVASGILLPVLEDCAVTVGLVRTVRIRPEQYLAGGERT